MLPLTLTKFNAIPENSGVVLSWSTENEYNNQSFEVEKSSNNSEFSLLDKVPAAGHSSIRRHYNLTDYNPFNGDTYYRLKSVDKDGV